MPAEIKITLDDSGPSPGGGGGRAAGFDDFEAFDEGFFDRYYGKTPPTPPPLPPTYEEDRKRAEEEDKRWLDQIERVAKQARDAEEADRKREAKEEAAARKQEARELREMQKLLERMDKEEERAEKAAAKDEERELKKVEKAAKAARAEEEKAEREALARFRRNASLTVGAAGAGGTAMVGLPQNQIMPGVQAATDVAARGLNTLGRGGIAAAAALQIGTMAVTAFSKTVDGFVARGRELAGMNGQLAGASAYADITRMRSDLREAQELGPQMARLIENQAKTEATIRELLLPVKNFVLEFLNDALETALETGVSALEALKDIAEAVGAGDETLEKMEGMVRRIRDIMDGSADADPINTWLKDMDRFIAPPAAPPAPRAVPFGLLPGGL